MRFLFQFGISPPHLTLLIQHLLQDKALIFIACTEETGMVGMSSRDVRTSSHQQKFNVEISCGGEEELPLP